MKNPSILWVFFRGSTHTLLPPPRPPSPPVFFSFHGHDHRKRVIFCFEAGVQLCRLSTLRYFTTLFLLFSVVSMSLPNRSFVKHRLLQVFLSSFVHLQRVNSRCHTSLSIGPISFSVIFSVFVSMGIFFNTALW